MNNWKSWFFLAFLAFNFSCTQDRVYEEFHAFQTLNWNEKDSVTFDLKELEENQGKKLIGVRFNDEYPFSNCYIRVISRDTIGQILDNKLINVPLFDAKSGQPKGEGFGNTFTFYDTLPFDLSDQTREVVFLQYMRQENLPGMEAVGLKILK